MRSQLAAIGVILFLGCGPSDQASGDSTMLVLEEVARLGSQFEGGSAFTRVSAIEVTPAEILVLESDPPRVAVFDHEGEWLRDLGRKGEGPGEFRRPTVLGLHDGLVWVGDPAGGRIEVFSPDGAHVHSVRWSLPADTLGTRIVPMGIFEDGSILAGPPGSLSIGAVVRGAVTHRTYHQASDEGTLSAKLYVEDIVADDFTTAEFPGGGIMLGVHPIRQSPLVKAYPNGAGLVAVERVVSDDVGEAVFNIRSIRPDGTSRFDTSVHYTPISAERWLDRYLAKMETDMLERSGSVDRGFISAVAGGLAPRPTFPPVTDLVAGADGSIWVRREETQSDSVAWDIFDSSGVQSGSVLTPRGLTILRASGEDIWAVELDDLDVPWVLRLALRR